MEEALKSDHYQFRQCGWAIMDEVAPGELESDRTSKDHLYITHYTDDYSHPI